MPVHSKYYVVNNRNNNRKLVPKTCWVVKQDSINSSVVSSILTTSPETNPRSPDQVLSESSLLLSEDEISFTPTTGKVTVYLGGSALIVEGRCESTPVPIPNFLKRI